MFFDLFFNSSEDANVATIKRLESYHLRRTSPVILLLFLGMGAFIYWASVFKVDEVAHAYGEVITRSRVQIIQAVDGGVLEALHVREGDGVKIGQLLATLDQTRFGASVKEIEARLAALKTKAVRLRGEQTHQQKLFFPKELYFFEEQINVEIKLFNLRRDGLKEELRTLKKAVKLAKDEVKLVVQLKRSGDVTQTEIIRTQRGLNDAESRLIIRKNKFFEDVSTELTKVEDQIAQNEQVLTQRKQQLKNSKFHAQMSGIVKNIRVTTVGGVLRAGEELMQIIPIDEELILEVKVSPADIARVRKDLEANIRFDPFDYTIFGSVLAKVIYVSADTLKENTPQGEEIYYRAHVTPITQPVITTTEHMLEIQPGMTAQVDIRTGERTLMDFLLKPLKKTIFESFGER